MKRMMRWLAPSALLALPGVALAQGGNLTEGDEPGGWRDLSVMGQAGVLAYTGEAARLTTAGMAFGVMVGVDVVPWVDAELSYQSATYLTDDNLALDQVGINENGGQLLAKVGPDGRRWEPYALGGVAVTGLNVRGGDDFLGVVEDAALVKLPVGAGLDYHIPMGDAEGDLRVGARTVYNVTLNSGAFPTLDEPSAANQFQTTLHFGASF